MVRKSMMRCCMWVAIAVAAGPRAFGGGVVPEVWDREAAVRVITRWCAGEGIFCCSGKTRSDWDNMLDAWYDEITDDHGSKNWVEDGFYVNNTHGWDTPDTIIVNPDFADCSFSFGNDCATDMLDDVDVYMVGLHGKDADGDRWYGVMREWTATTDCQAEQEEMILGDLDLEFLHLASCESMNKESWWPEWNSTFAGLHQIDGFHGLMWISTSYNDRYEDFGDDAFEEGIADAWVDNHYDPAHWYETWQSYDHCPVARGVGASSADVDDRMTNEEYDNIFTDLDAGDILNDKTIYVDGCDPKSEGPL